MRVDDLKARVDDFHTHVPAPRAIINTSPGDERPEGYLYSVGIHPWESATASEADFKAILDDLSDANVVAIGECGLDRLRGPELAIQRDVFVRQLELAEKAGKPVIIHCVRAFDELLRLRKQLRPSVDWIVHGFRGKPELARQLADTGMYLSLGRKYNPAVLSVVNPSQILHETDAM